jgi:hypothetical protein
MQIVIEVNDRIFDGWLIVLFVCFMAFFLMHGYLAGSRYYLTSNSLIVCTRPGWSGEVMRA